MKKTKLNQDRFDYPDLLKAYRDGLPGSVLYIILYILKTLGVVLLFGISWGIAYIVINLVF